MKHISLIIAALFFVGFFILFHTSMSIAAEKTDLIVVDIQGDFTT